MSAPSSATHAGAPAKALVPTRWRLDVEYCGKGYLGWARQRHGKTIQHALEQALSQVMGHPVRVSGSSRTDAGVHALGQVASFVTGVSRPPSAIRDGTNAQLNPGIVVVSARSVCLDFDPRHWAVQKHYRYRWLDRQVYSPLRSDVVWWHRRPLHVNAMAEAAAMLVGQHDFSAFRAAGCDAKHTIRTIDRVAVTRHQDEVHLDIYGNGFLRHMVRIIAGTLAQVGAGRRSPQWVQAVMDSKDRTQAGQTAPPQGLCLVAIRHGNGPTRRRDRN